MQQNRVYLKFLVKITLIIRKYSTEFCTKSALRKTNTPFPSIILIALLFLAWVPGKEAGQRLESWWISKTFCCYLLAKCLYLHSCRLNEYMMHLHCLGILETPPLRTLESENLRLLKYRNFSNLQTKRFGMMESTIVPSENPSYSQALTDGP